MQKDIRSVPFYSSNPLGIGKCSEAGAETDDGAKRADKKNVATAYAPTETGSMRSPTALTAHGVMAT
nr:hypothetical protein [Peptoniphilus coxii]